MEPFDQRYFSYWRDEPNLDWVGTAYFKADSVYDMWNVENEHRPHGLGNDDLVLSSTDLFFLGSAHYSSEQILRLPRSLCIEVGCAPQHHGQPPFLPVMRSVKCMRCAACTSTRCFSE